MQIFTNRTDVFAWACTSHKASSWSIYFLLMAHFAQARYASEDSTFRSASISNFCVACQGLCLVLSFSAYLAAANTSSGWRRLRQHSQRQDCKDIYARGDTDTTQVHVDGRQVTFSNC
eukprot:Protomagalhaensia_wolfi_Nauph_80__1536@NODE_1938_length_1271_cov_2408_540584_g752_i2_p2_GENE_NODE_1938_length_1271_cov_2408_540584_g752_i2NODE_1938_length_1271_cov_2408_540584_g752_i2_p2_ORF_typecomplete_len118_score0_55TGBp3/PF02495_17/1_8e03TGBp3/PF02495_17/3_3e02TGBp3/PF02495_17/0_95_NODE_1938_length_1271_cov_2408_540584_g752_i27381091